MFRSKFLISLATVVMFLVPFLIINPVSAHDESLYALKTVAPIQNYTVAACYDIAIVNRGKLYLADATNKAVDVIDGKHVKMVGEGLDRKSVV